LKGSLKGRKSEVIETTLTREREKKIFSQKSRRELKSNRRGGIAARDGGGKEAGKKKDKPITRENAEGVKKGCLDIVKKARGPAIMITGPPPRGKCQFSEVGEPSS